MLLLAAALLLGACGAPLAGPTGAASSSPTGSSTEVPVSTPTGAQDASSSGTPAQGTLRFTDGLGREISLPGPAQRVVSLAPSNTEILFAVGAGSQVIARDEFSDYPASAGSLPAIGGSFGGYNNEAIVALEPDLVLAAEINTPEQVKSLADLGLNVYYLKNPVGLEGLYENLRIVAELTGRQPEAEKLIASLEERVQAVVSKTGSVTGRPKVFYELDSTDPNAPYTAGPGTFMDMLINMAGGQNIGGALDSAWAQISAEELLVQDPDVILLGDAAYGVTPESVAARPGWENLEAVKSGRVYPFDDNLASRPGPRLVDGLEALAKLLHPDLFNP